MNNNGFNIQAVLKDKSTGFYVGLAGALLAIVTMFLYISMNSMFFTGWVVFGLLAGVVMFVLAAVTRLQVLYVPAYGLYLFALYHFLVLEVERRMDVLVDPAQGFFALDGIFYAACIFFLACIIVTIVASVMKQEKSPV